MKQRITSPCLNKDEREVENTLRPRTLGEFIGQENIKKRLEIFIQAAQERKEALDHILFSGPPGLGKTTLAYIVANFLKAKIKSISGAAIERAGDLVAILTNLEEGDVLFIDEIHRIPRIAEEILYPAMEDYKIDIVIGKGPGAKIIKLDLPFFTLIGATTRTGLLTSPLRDRFGISDRLGYYSPEDLYKIVMRAAGIFNLSCDEQGAREIARRARGTPRVANRLLRRVRDYAQVKAKGIITASVARDALQMLEVDECGLDETDRLILSIIMEKFKGGPVGLETIAIAVHEEPETIADVHESYLIQIGFIDRTSRGRVATRRAYAHLNRDTSYLKMGAK